MKLRLLNLKRRANKIKGTNLKMREVSTNMERRVKRRKIHHNYPLKRNLKDHQTNKFY